MKLPLLDDLRQDATPVQRRLGRIALFVAVLLGVDFAIGTLLSRGLERYFGLDVGADIPVVSQGVSLTLSKTENPILPDLLRVLKNQNSPNH